MLDIEKSTAQANAIDSVLAASNPFIYQGENASAPARKGGRAGRRLDKFSQRQAVINQTTATLNAIDDIYAASNPHLYQPAATFNAWQANRPRPDAAYGDWQAQQVQLADTQAQIAQYWQTQTDSSQNQAVSLNVTNNFKGVTQDRRLLNDIGEYLAQQIRDDLNAGRTLCSYRLVGRRQGVWRAQGAAHQSKASHGGL